MNDKLISPRKGYFEDLSLQIQDLRDKSGGLIVGEFGELQTRAVVADGRNSVLDATLIVPSVFNARLGSDADDNEVQRAVAIAVATESRVVAVDTPGVGYEHAHERFSDIVAALRGDISALAREQMEAVIKAAGLEDGDEVGFLGYSLGAFTAAVALREMQCEALSKKLQVSSVSLLETVNDADWGLINLLKVLGKESNRENVDRYLRYNQIYALAQPADISSTEPLARIKVRGKHGMMQSTAVGKASTRGFRDDLVRTVQADGDRVTGLRDAPIIIFRTNGSTVARADESMRTYEALHAIHPDTEHVTGTPMDGEPDHRHPFWQSMGHAAYVAQLLHEY